ncbi:MAG: phosphoglycerate kinase [Candidatus Staskawiczbacteria bacterium]|jgi:phosphoglycerate kinase
MKTIRDFNVKNKRVLVRCDFNVPVDEQGNILDDFKIRQTLPTIQYLQKNKARIILMSHLGEPEGQAVPSLTMDKVQERLVALLKSPVVKAPDCIGYEIDKYTYGLVPGDIFLLENLRFHKEEKENNSEFAKSLARLGDFYVNDAFGACHRPHASIVGVPQYIEGGIGLLVEKEIQNLEKLLKYPEKPMVAVIGGNKIETKAGVVNKISENADVVLVSTLIKEGIEKTGVALSHPEKIVGPVDDIIFEGKKLDIGPQSVKLFCKKIKKAKTIFWNGPFGMTEKEEFANGTTKIAKAIAKKWFCFKVVGGGETIEFLTKLGLAKKFNHISTGGGAMLYFLSGEELPGLGVLKIPWQEKEK